MCFYCLFTVDAFKDLRNITILSLVLRDYFKGELMHCGRVSRGHRRSSSATNRLEPDFTYMNICIYIFYIYYDFLVPSAVCINTATCHELNVIFIVFIIIYLLTVINKVSLSFKKSVFKM